LRFVERKKQNLSFQQIGSLAHWINLNLQFSQLQEVWTNGHQLVFTLYNQREVFLVIETDKGAPKAGVFLERPRVEKKAKPVSLFLNSHAKNLRLATVEVAPEKGRVLTLSFLGGPKKVILEVVLIPRAFNLIAQVFVEGEKVKSISWEKPRDLPASQGTDQDQDFPEIDWFQFSQELFAQPKAEKIESERPQRSSQQREKLEKLMRQLEQQLKTLEPDSWRELGEALKSHTSPDELPSPFKELYDPQLSLSKNRELAFSKYRQQDEKRQRILSRLDKVKKEYEELESSKDLDATATAKARLQPSAPGLLEKAGAKGRRLVISPQVSAVIGKSAKDNLNILRRAQPWDLWIHLKDFPSAHAIITRPRDFNISPSVIEQVAQWIIRETFRQKKLSMGEDLDVLVVEARFVKPIKGDSAGRVTYTSAKTIRVRREETKS
jgi:predicted ribosome quality control (RQC) complex YloA/Tae2 family protein